MTYDYDCPSCGWSGERRGVRIDARDEQLCTQEHETKEMEGQPLMPVIRLRPCATLLKRVEISLTARMPENWAGR